MALLHMVWTEHLPRSFCFYSQGWCYAVADPRNILTFARPSMATPKMPRPFSFTHCTFLIAHFVISEKLIRKWGPNGQNLKKILREFQAQFSDKLRQLRLQQNEGFSMKTCSYAIVREALCRHFIDLHRIGWQGLVTIEFIVGLIEHSMDSLFFFRKG